VALINCEECGKQISDSAAACPGCGGLVTKTIDCFECGKTMSGLAKSCPECGAPAPKKDDLIKGIGDIGKNVADLAKSSVAASLGDSADNRIRRFKLIIGGIYFSLILTLFFHVIPLLVGFFITVMMKADAKETWLESHFKYLTNTYKWALFLIVAFCMLILIVAVLFPGESPYGGKKYEFDHAFLFMLYTPYLTLPWLLFRAIKGGLTLSRNEPMVQ